MIYDTGRIIPGFFCGCNSDMELFIIREEGRKRKFSFILFYFYKYLKLKIY